MKIILANGNEVEPIVVTGEVRWVQGAQRDTLTFVFPAETSLDTLDGIFTSDNCESITVVDGTGSYIHKGYTIRAELSRAPVVVTPATESGAEVTEERVTVSMAQRTYAETQLNSLMDTVDALVMENLLKEDN